MYQVVMKLKSMKSPLNKLSWGKGNLFKRVEMLINHLQVIQTEIDHDPHNHMLTNKETRLIAEVYESENDEEKVLYQQARIKWLNEGDKNSIYFHRVLKGKSNKSKVFSLYDDAGIIHEGDQIPQLFLRQFEMFLGTSQHVQNIQESVDLFTSRLNERDVENMIHNITDAKIKNAMFDIDDYKAPGPDDYLLVMCHGDIVYVKVIKKAMQEFSSCYGLLPNNAKSSVFFKSLKKEDRNSITSVLPFEIRKLPVKYLRVPLISKRLGINESGCLLDKIKNEINNWRNKSLCYAGRLQLIVDVLEMNTSLWYDNWSSIGPLFEGRDYRSLYDARLKMDLKVSDLICNEEWKWPDDWHIKFPNIVNLIVKNSYVVSEVEKRWSISFKKVINKTFFESKGLVPKTDLLCLTKRTMFHGRLVFSGDTNRKVPVNETFHVQTDDELTEKELKQIEADDQAIQTILLGLSEDIYAAVDSCETAQEIWESEWIQCCTECQESGNANQNVNGNLVAARAEGNATGHNGNQIRCYNCRRVGYFARNCTVRPRRRDAAYLQTQLLIAQKEKAGI
uniref:RNA-directed DNA polymerase, eukaryota, reverse transcriptase zinc-binding domain protein n=1 Tax=Tanacetum cinerariifolium TaxID=118510 RepID=A0A699IKI2_TANCI|nr:hypothetical protein [Tanacetum cinerariifolium]